jgi:hypothetical protein
MKSAWKLCAILFLATVLVSQGAMAQTGTSKPTKKKAAAPALTAADVQALKDAIASQQAAIAQQAQQIQELRDELHQRNQAVQQAQTAASDAASKADAAQSTAAQQQQTVSALSSDVGDLKANMVSTAMTLQDTQKNVKDALESPLALHYRGVTITPGGFIAAEFVRRNRALASDVNTPFNNITAPGASQSSISEFFGSGRQSRLSLLVEGQLSMAKLSGYYEADFLSAAASSNNNESNSYSMRQRQIWAQAAFNNGFSFTGGQMWSLVTETKHGMDNRTEALPMVIDANYNVGFSWARQYGLRIVKNIDNKVWFGLSMEAPQATVTTHNNVGSFLVGSAGSSGGLYNQTITTCTTANNAAGNPVTTCTPTASYAFNPSPDIIAKVAFEPGFGHYEIFGVYSRFRDRVFPCGETAPLTGTCDGITGPSAALAFNSSKNGGGVGANARWSFFNKHLDFGLHAFGGQGIGRYAPAGLPDASVHGDGTLNLVKNYQGLATLEWHGPKVDIYMNVGTEYAGRAFSFDPVLNKIVGYGSPTFNNSGCYTETVPQNGTGFLPGGLAGCTSDARAITEGTLGFWFKLYDGSKGEMKVNHGRIQWGPQFSYVNRSTWSGANGLEPHGLDGMIFTSFRYYLP